jgi:hypothetical protein
VEIVETGVQPRRSHLYALLKGKIAKPELEGEDEPRQQNRNLDTKACSYKGMKPKLGAKAQS